MKARGRTPIQIAVAAVHRILRKAGFEIRPIREPHERCPDLPTPWQETIQRTAPYTLVSPERMAALIQAVEHVVACDVPGAIVECGVLRGGSSMAAALTLDRLGARRELYLFDTFEGMPAPGPLDLEYTGKLSTYQEVGAGMSEVVRSLRSVGINMEHVHMIKGMVEETVPTEAPDEIAVLRLDTDWYESTRHELEHLYPRLSPGGVLIVDDYGHFLGARKAVDDYFAGQRVFLHRLDYTGRLVIK
jgi:O-methyltransferase